MHPMNEFIAAQKVRAGRTLIVGSKVHPGTGKIDRRRLFKSAVGIDMEGGEGVDLILDLEEPVARLALTFLKCSPFDHVECTSVLEHSRRPWLMAENIEHLMAPGATILMMVPWVWRIHGYPSDYFRYTPAAIESLFPRIEWTARNYIVEDRIVEKVPTFTGTDGIRYLARSELIMFGHKSKREQTE